jgi:hypothetical protein
MVAKGDEKQCDWGVLGQGIFVGIETPVKK